MSESEKLEMFRDMLNECYPPVKICGYDYDAARAFEEVDPIAFRCEYANWESALEEEQEEDEG